MTSATADHPRALVDRIGQQFLDLVERRRLDQRSLLHAVVEAIADLQRTDGGSQLVGEGFGHPALHQDAVGADTGLPGIAILRGHRAFDRGIEVGIVENQERGIAAEFQRQLLDRRRALRHQDPTDLGRAGERELAHRRIGAHFATDCPRVAGDDVEHPGRNAGPFGEFGQRQSRQRRRFGGFDHHRAAGGQRRPGLAGDHRGREVPRGDRRADSDRLLGDENPLVGLVRRNQVTIGALAFLSEPLDERCRIGDLAARLGQWLALLDRHQAREILLVGQHQIVPAAQQPRAITGGARAPRRQRALGCSDRLARLVGSEVRHRGDRSSVRRIGDVEARVVGRRQPAAIHIAFVPQQS